MPEERRRFVRREVAYACWIGAGDPSELIEGNVRNIADGGAMVVFSTPAKIPGTVDLYMTPDGRVGRRCKVIWRANKATGLMFLGKSSLEASSTVVEI